jgi:uroporphyrinogen decarboxylase
MRIFGPGGGFVFNSIHNIQPQVPVENVLALYETFRECSGYPCGAGET